jgi:hypothetical protein
MTRKSRTAAKPSEAPADHDIQRVRINRDGYDASGAYWGAGPDVFIATSADGADEITVRAKTIAEARLKVAAELTCKPGDAKSKGRDPLGGAAPRTTRYEIDWLNPVTHDAVRIRITHQRDYLVSGTDHLSVDSLKPKKAPLPITATGYLSHFIPALQLVNAGGPVTFITAWLDRETKSKTWQKQVAAKVQGDLFQWADAKAEVSKRRAKPKAPTPKPLSPKPRKPPKRTPQPK